ncbi:MAG: DNA primase [Bacilli bacterium]|nr:DNA primase [Bacilli bacterium]
MNTLSQEKLNEIRNSVDIVDVVSNYVSLTPRGKNFFGVCPFHDDNNPSMSVSQAKQMYRCFSCGATGSVFHFIRDYENISFSEAVKKVAEIGGVKVDIRSDKKIKNNIEYHEIYSLSLKYYMNNLNSKSGKEAREYLNNRNIDDTTIKEFQIGLSLDKRNSLSNLLIKKFKEKDILDSALVGKNDYGMYDFFQERIMFPLYDLNGKVVAYSGRIYNKEDSAKYFNTRETEVFKKGELLYNYHRARNVARMKNKIIIVEGFMDVIRMHTIGVKNVIAMMGTAVTDKQAHLIKRMAKEVILCFDGDSAGAKATKSCIDELSKIDVIPKVVRLEDKLDPDEYILKYGKDKFLRKIDNPINVIDFELSYYKEGKDLNSAEDKTLYIKQIIDEINKIDDEILKEVTIKKIVDETEIDESLIRSRIKKKTKKAKRDVINKLSKYEKAEKNLIYFMLKSDDVIKMYDKKVTFMPDSEYRLLAREISAYYHEYGFINEVDFMDYALTDDEFKQTLKKVNQNNKREEFTFEEIDDYINVIKEFNVNKAIKRMQKEIKDLTDPLEKAKIAQKIIELKKGV